MVGVPLCVRSWFPIFAKRRGDLKGDLWGGKEEKKRGGGEKSLINKSSFIPISQAPHTWDRRKRILCTTSVHITKCKRQKCLVWCWINEQLLFYYVIFRHPTQYMPPHSWGVRIAYSRWGRRRRWLENGVCLCSYGGCRQQYVQYTHYNGEHMKKKYI